MAILTKTVFDNPYVDIGNAHDICTMCRSEYTRTHPDKYGYQIDNALAGDLDGKKIFKLFRNSNTPFILCAKHIKEAADMVQEEE